MKRPLEIGMKAPEFSLIGTDGLIYSSNQIKGARAICIFFTCNHCPYVRGQDDYLSNLAQEYEKFGAKFIAINSNSAMQNVEDSYDGMVRRMEEKKFPWPYLHDATQSTAKAFGAGNTPEFFLFNQNHLLIYTGRALDNPKEPDQATNDALKDALDQILESRPVTVPVTTPVGCTIKWEGKEASQKSEACSFV